MRNLPLMISLGLLAPVGAVAEEPVQTVAFYALGIGLDGQATAGALTSDIDMSTSEVFDHLEFGAMGAYRWDSASWSIQVDVMYASLAGEGAGGRGLGRATLDLDQAMMEVDAGYQLTDNLEVTIGARYWDYETDIALYGSGPAGIVQRSAGSDSWVDPLVGLRLIAPINERWTFVARGDVGGFGVGSEFAWHATALLDWRIGQTFSMIFGYRVFDFDYENGEGAQSFGLDLQQSGPGIGVAFSF